MIEVLQLFVNTIGTPIGKMLVVSEQRRKSPCRGLDRL